MGLDLGGRMVTVGLSVFGSGKLERERRGREGAREREVGKRRGSGRCVRQVVRHE